MRVPWREVCLLVASFAVGCGNEPTPGTTPPAPTPLSVAQWRELPVGEKYDEATFARLKMQDPRLQTDRGWHRFMAETVVPERKKDLPDDILGN
ncbi:MAG: hypothetical protein WD070_11845 [Pirellulaceae bacterium]